MLRSLSTHRGAKLDDQLKQQQQQQSMQIVRSSD